MRINIKDFLLRYNINEIRRECILYTKDNLLNGDANEEENKSKIITNTLARSFIKNKYFNNLSTNSVCQLA